MSEQRQNTGKFSSSHSAVLFHSLFGCCACWDRKGHEKKKQHKEATRLSLARWVNTFFILSRVSEKLLCAIEMRNYPEGESSAGGGGDERIFITCWSRSFPIKKKRARAKISIIKVEIHTEASDAFLKGKMWLRVSGLISARARRLICLQPIWREDTTQQHGMEKLILSTQVLTTKVGEAINSAHLNTQQQSC